MAGTEVREISRRAQRCCSILQHRGAKAVPPLLAALQVCRRECQVGGGTQALGQTFQPAAVPGLIAALRDDADGGAKVSIMFAASYICTRTDGPSAPLRKLTDDPGPGHVASLMTIQHIEEARRDTPGGTPASPWSTGNSAQDALHCCGEQFGQPERDRLERQLTSDDGDVTYTSLFALGALDSRSSVPAIIAAPTSGMKFLVLSKLGTPEAVDHVVQRLHSLNPSTRDVALEGLAQGADRWGAPLLIALLDDPALKVEARGTKPEDILSPRGPLDNWPEWHKAHHQAPCLPVPQPVRPQGTRGQPGQQPDE